MLAKYIDTMIISGPESENLIWILGGNRKETTITASICVVYPFWNSYFGFWFDLAHIYGTSYLGCSMDGMAWWLTLMVVFGIANCHCVWYS